jgi:tRNA A37 threonylcarbamoyladenosine synthetase subunit TsaC/SUA5/YrdC
VVLDYYTDPDEIYTQHQKSVDIMIDGGTGGNQASTVLDCTQPTIQLIRKGLGDIDFLDLNN